MNVLVVEDIPDVALTFAALIRAYGHRTQVAYDGSSALQMVREFKPHTVFIDIHLPGMNGYELATHLRVQLFRVEVIRILPDDDVTRWSFEATFSHTSEF